MFEISNSCLRLKWKDSVEGNKSKEKKKYISRDLKPWIIASPALYGVQSGDIGDKNPVLEDPDGCFRVQSWAVEAQTARLEEPGFTLRAEGRCEGAELQEHLRDVTECVPARAAGATPLVPARATATALSLLPSPP